MWLSHACVCSRARVPDVCVCVVFLLTALIELTFCNELYIIGKNVYHIKVESIATYKCILFIYPFIIKKNYIQITLYRDRKEYIEIPGNNYGESQENASTSTSA